MELLPESWHLILSQLEPFDRYALMFCCKNLSQICKYHAKMIVLPQLQAKVNRYKSFGLCRTCREQVIFAKCSCKKQENKDTFSAIFHVISMTNEWFLLIRLWKKFLKQYWETSYLSALYTIIANTMTENYKKHRSIPKLIRQLKLAYRFACRNRIQANNLEKHLVRYMDIRWTSYVIDDIVNVARHLPKSEISDVEIIARLDESAAN